MLFGVPMLGYGCFLGGMVMRVSKMYGNYVWKMLKLGMSYVKYNIL